MQHLMNSVWKRTAEKFINWFLPEKMELPSYSSAYRQRRISGEVFHKHDVINCSCGWKGKGADSIKKFRLLNEEVVELELFCAECNKYLGFVLYKDECLNQPEPAIHLK